MKRRIGSLLIALLILVSAVSAGALAAGNMPNVLRQDGLFTMQFDSLTGAEAHAMQLKTGDQLSVISACEAGTLTVVIKRDSGDVIFTVDGTAAPGTFVDIPADGVYRIMVEGKGARGNVRIERNMVISEGKEMPHRLEYIKGSLGYQIEYDVDTYRYEARDAGDFFFSLGGDANPDLLYGTYVWIGRYEGSLDAQVQTLLAEPGAVEQPATIIDYRAARTVRHQTGETPDSKVILSTLVEAGQDLIFVVTATYNLADEATVGTQFQAMVDSLRFDY